METELLEDLNEALEGIDPVELLLADGEFCSVVEELINCGDFTDLLDDAEYAFDDSPSLCSPAASANSFDETFSSTSSLSPISYSSATENLKCTRKRSTKSSCKVCQRPAKGHKYFGVVVCFGCRSFFSRAMKNRHHMTFACKAVKSGGDEHCQGDKLFKCQKCRFEKCLQEGMTAPASYDNEDELIASNLVEDRTQELATLTSAFRRNSKVFLGLSSDMSSDERSHVEHFVTLVCQKSYMTFARLIENNLQVFKSMMEFMYQGKTVPLKMQKLTQDYLCYSAANDYLTNMIHDNHLSQRDRERLGQANFASALEFMEAYRMNKMGSVKMELFALVESLQKCSNQEVSKAVKSLHSEASLNGKLDPQEAVYERSYAQESLGRTREDRERHQMLVNKVSNMGSVAGKSAVYDPIILILTSSIILFSTDSLDLDDSKEAERMQLMYVRILQRYLKGKNEPGTNKMLSECILTISYARELRDFRRNAFKNLK